MQVAVVNRSTDPVVARNLAFWVRAVNQQMVEHFLPAYESWLRTLGMTAEHWPAVAYASFENLDPSKVTPLVILDDGPPGQLGSHSNTGGIVTARAKAVGLDTCSTISHEVNEDRGDHPCTLMIRQPDGSALAHETDDPVETTTYTMEVDVLGEKRVAEVSNFVLPSWFVPDSRGPWDFISTGRAEKEWLLKGPGDVLPGCHAVVMNPRGLYSTVYGSGGSPAAHIEKHVNVKARTHRRFQSVPDLRVPPKP